MYNISRGNKSPVKGLSVSKEHSMNSIYCCLITFLSLGSQQAMQHLLWIWIWYQHLNLISSFILLQDLFLHDLSKSKCFFIQCLDLCLVHHLHEECFISGLFSRLSGLITSTDHLLHCLWKERPCLDVRSTVGQWGKLFLSTATA